MLICLYEVFLTILQLNSYRFRFEMPPAVNINQNQVTIAKKPVVPYMFRLLSTSQNLVDILHLVSALFQF